MTPQHWQQVKHIFQSVLDYPPDMRAAFLDEACASDPALRSEVESLISSHDQAGDSIEAMAGAVAAQMVAGDHASSFLESIGPYKVIRQIGKGGMGEVYLAEDPRLRRRVAIKVLRGEFAQNEDRLRRFQREAHAASALNHPNILTIHEVGQINSLNFIVAEFIEGETLREHMSGAPMLLAEVLEVGMQVAAGLAAAHTEGIIHRDIKPENIMIRRDGIIKVLDFGLAKLALDPPATSDTETATMATKTNTEQGAIMGTVAYMSPEQARGLKVDERTDIFSLGVVLYEMVAGKTPFAASTKMDTLAAILNREPELLAEFKTETPRELEHVISKSLRKDPDERYQTIKDMLIDLKDVKRELSLEVDLERSLSPKFRSLATAKTRATTQSSEPGTAQSSKIGWLVKRWPIPLASVLLLVSAVTVSLWLSRRHSAAPPEANRYAPVALTRSPMEDTDPCWTRDGRIRFIRIPPNHQGESWVMNVDGTNQSKVNDFPNLRFGVWSPDGQKVIFGKSNEGTTLYLANADGSNEIALPFSGGNSDWSPDSREIVYQQKIGSQSDVFIYSVETGRSRNVTNRPDAFDGDPTFSPDAHQIAFVSDRDGNLEIYVMDRDGSNIRRLTNNPATDSHPVFSPDGTQIIFDSDREKEHSDVFIMNADGSSAPVNLINWENSAQYVLPGCWSPDGTKIVFTSDRSGKGDLYVMSAESFRPQLVLSDATKDLRFPSYSPDGRFVAYQAASKNKGGELRIWNPKTQVDSLIIATASAGFAPVWSPGGESIAFQDTIEGQTDICLINPDGSGLKNLTQNPARDGSPAWSPSGKQIAFVSNRDGDYGRLQIYVMNTDGSNQHCVYYTKAMSADPCWSPDGKCIVFANDREGDRLGNFEIFSIQPDTSAPERRLTFRRGYDVYPVFSPSGKRIAFVSNADGNPEIYVMNADGTRLLRLTRDPADDITPRWSPDETKLIFSSNRGGKFALYELPAPQ